MVAVIVATNSEVKKTAFETSEFGAYLRGIGVKYDFIECDGGGDDFAGKRFPQPFTSSGGILAAMQRITRRDDDVIVVAIESYITDNAKDCVCIVVNYYVNGEKRELIAFSPPEYVASFPEKYLQHLAVIEKYQPGALGFNTTIGDVIELEKNIHGGGVSNNWHKLFNPFDRVEQIRETLNYIVDEFKKIVCVY